MNYLYSKVAGWLILGFSVSGPPVSLVYRNMIQTSGLIRHLFKSVATALLLWWVLRQVDIESGIRLLADSDFALLAAATVVLALLMVPATLRWRYVLRNLGLDYPYGLLLQWNLAAGFFNNILPTGVGGDVLRAEWSRRSGLKIATAWSVVYGLANLISSLPGAGVWVFLKHQPNQETTK